MVLESDQPLYERLYACMVEARQDLGHAQGLRGFLERTKTSGAGKASSTLPLFVSTQAYIVHEDWLKVGHKFRAALQ
eukprot:8813483-Heterocapsa_arctica.AAC.1